MKLAVVGYLPPPKLPVANAFVENIRKFAPRCDTILYSEHPWTDTPGNFYKLKLDPEELKKDKRFTGPGQPPGGHPFAVNNAVFFTGLRMASQNGVTHMLYLEADCRVNGEGWDEKIFDEAFRRQEPFALAGSMVCYNPTNAGREAHRRWAECVAANLKRNYPIPTYGWQGAASAHPSCVFVNGAGGIYDVAWMLRLFELADTVALTFASTAWDMQTGQNLWKLMGVQSYDLVTHLTSMYSSYGNVITTQAQRQALLTSKKVCLVHQIKDSWAP